MPTVEPGAATLTLTGAAPTIWPGTFVAPTAVTFTLTAATPTVSFGTVTFVAPPAATFALTSAAPTILPGTFAGPGTAALTLTGHEPTVWPLYVRPAATTLTLTGHAPDVSAQFLRPAPASLVLTGYAPIVWPLYVRPAAATFALTGQAPTIVPGAWLSPAAASFTLTPGLPIFGHAVLPPRALVTVFGHAPLVPPIIFEDIFNRTDAVGKGLGGQWRQIYTGAGAGELRTDNRRARWFPSGTGARSVRNIVGSINAVHTISLTGQPTGGYFILIFDGNPTAPIPYDATEGQVQAALELLPNINVGDVIVSRVHSSSGPGAETGYTVLWQGGQGGSNGGGRAVDTFTADGSQLTGGGLVLGEDGLPYAVNPDCLIGKEGPSRPGVTASDNQEIEIEIGEYYQWPWPDDAFIEIYGRVNDSATTFVRGILEATKATLSVVIDGVEKLVKTVQLPTPPRPLEVWALRVGEVDEEPSKQTVILVRNEAETIRVSLPDSLTRIGQTFRGFGFGVGVGSGASSQDVPPAVNRFMVRDTMIKVISFTGEPGSIIGSLGALGGLARLGATPLSSTLPSSDGSLESVKKALLALAGPNAPSSLISLINGVQGIGGGSGGGGSGAGGSGSNNIKWSRNQLTFTNFGTEDGWPRYLCFGPGTFNIQDGPGGKIVEFGPLVDGQIALLTTLPRLRGVVDLSPSQPAPQQLSSYQDFIRRLISLATNNNVPPLLEWFQSLFGIRPPQGELYSLLKGRFTKPIPPKPAGAKPTPVTISARIVNGGSRSKIIGALTPMRRWPE